MPDDEKSSVDSPLEPLRQYLLAHADELRDQIKKLQEGPFLAGEKRLPLARSSPERLSLDDAARHESLFDNVGFKTFRGAGALFLLLLAICFAWLTYSQYKQSLGIGINSWFTWGLPVLFFLKGFRFVPLVGAILSLGGSVCLAFVKLPVHEPDPLFDRILQERSPSPVSKFIIAKILADPRFVRVFERASDTTFPFAQESMEHFIDRLIGHLDPQGQCARFFVNHQVQALAGEGGIVFYYLEHEMREMLFAEIFDDPAFVYIYKRNQPKWRQVLAWFSTFDFEKAKKFFSSGESHHEKPDKVQGAVNVGFVLIAVVLLTHVYEAKRDETTLSHGEKEVVLNLESSAQFSAFTKTMLEAMASPKCPPTAQPTAMHPSVVVNNLPPPQSSSPAPVVNLTTPHPDPLLPAKIDVTVESNAKPTDIEISGLDSALALAANAIDSHYKPSARHVGGDDYAIFTYTRLSEPTPPQTPTPISPDPTAPPKIAGTAQTTPPVQAALLQNPPQFVSNETLLTLHTESGTACTYKARIAKDSRWPPNPVSIAVLSASANNPVECKPKIAQLTNPLPENSNVITATRTLSYSGLLHAYVSVEAFHRHHFPPFTKDYVVLRIHYDAEPRQTDN